MMDRTPRTLADGHLFSTLFRRPTMSKVMRLRLYAALLATAANVGDAEGQQGGRFAVGVVGGLIVGDPAGGTLGIDFSHQVFAGLRFTGSVSSWWTAQGCDLIVGLPCDSHAWSVDLGVTVGPKPRQGSVRPYGTIRMGGLFYESLDRRVWSPSIGLGFDWSMSQRTNLFAGIAYYALNGSRSDDAFPPSAADRVALQTGVRFRP